MKSLTLNQLDFNDFIIHIVELIFAEKLFLPIVQLAESSSLGVADDFRLYQVYRSATLELITYEIIAEFRFRVF